MSKQDLKLDHSHHYSSLRGQENEVFKLIVKNIPPDFNHANIRNIFQCYGNVTGVFRPRHLSNERPGWAFVSYGTRDEAERAIKEVGQLPPYDLIAHYAHNVEEKERWRKAKNCNGASVNNFKPKSSTSVTNTSVQKNSLSQRLRKVISESRLVPVEGASMLDHKGGELYSSLPKTFAGNDVYKQGLQHSAVGLDRSTYQDISHLIEIREYSVEEDYKIKEKLEDLCCRLNGVEDKRFQNSKLFGRCLNCTKMTSSLCQRCRAWYCSRECQLSDWPLHRPLCLPIPELCDSSDTLTTPGKKPKDEVSNKECASGTENPFTCNIEESKKLMTRERKEDGSINESKLHFSKTTRMQRSVNDRLNYRQVDKAKDKNFNIVPDSVLKPLPTRNVSEQSNFLSNQTELLSRNKFTRVKISSGLGFMTYWVQLIDLEEQLVDIMSTLNTGTETTCNPVGDPVLGMLCVAKYEGLWYRCKVTSVAPELKVLYIDFGNEENCTQDQLRMIPEAVKNIPVMAIKIKLAKGTPGKYDRLAEDKVLSVKLVDKYDDTFIVQVEGESYENKPMGLSQLSSLARRRNDARVPALLDLKTGVKGGIQFRQELGGDDFGVTIVYPDVKPEFINLFASLALYKNSAEKEDYKPSVGDVVAAFVEDASSLDKGSWLRGRVLADWEGSYKVSLCDYGQVTVVKRVRQLSENAENVKEFGARCSITSYILPRDNRWCREEKRFRFLVKSIDKTLKTVTCVLETDSGDLGTAVLKPWVPTIQDENPKVLLKNSDKVVLSAVHDGALWIRSAAEMHKESLLKIQKEVNEYSSRASELTETPGKGEIVACKFKLDGKYYRAKVQKLESNGINVVYIDYGNVDVVNRSNLKTLPLYLKKLPCMCVKAVMKNVDKSLNQAAIDLLSGLIDKEVEVTLKAEGMLKDGVEFIMPDGSNLNENVNKLLSIGKSQEEEDCFFPDLNSLNLKEEKIFMENDIKYDDLPVGEMIDFLLLHKMNNMTFMGCNANSKMVHYVHGILSTEINNYCESTPKMSYVPRITEVCFAKFEDSLWYRAVCIGSFSDENNILFLDFGNIAHIDSSNIRKMTEEFIKYPAIASICTLDNLPADMSPADQKRLIDSLVVENRVYKAHILKMDSEHGCYKIIMPHITKVL